MTKSAVITTWIDPELKTSTGAIFNDLGMTTDQAIIMFLEQVHLHKAIPFELKLPENYKPRTAGLNQGQSVMSDDFDKPLDDAFWNG